jgi:hypothetical protein
MWAQPGQAMLLPVAQTPAQEVIMSHQAHFAQAIAGRQLVGWFSRQHATT